jgi:peptidoglycan/xylan/chitin deacetylase (PgdA/CDA1 family)
VTDFAAFDLPDPTGQQNLNTPGVVHSQQHAAVNKALRSAKVEALQRSRVADGYRGGVVFTFDDGTIDHYTRVFPVFASRGLKAVFYLNTGTSGPHYIGKPDTHMNVAQVQELIADGQEIGAHGHQHQSIAVNTRAALEAVILPNKQGLEDLGAPEVTSYCAAGGLHTPFVLDIIGDYFDTLRLVSDGCTDVAYPNAIKQARNIEQACANLTLFQAMVNRAMAERRILILTGHVISELQATQMAAALDWLVSANVPVLTMKQAYAQTVKQRLSRRGGTLGHDGSVGASRVITRYAYSEHGVRVGRNGEVVIESASGQEAEDNPQLRLKGNTVETIGGALTLRHNDADCVQASRSTVAQDTAMLVRVNRNGAYSLDRVSIGPPDSGGTGFRALRVVN